MFSTTKVHLDIITQQFESWSAKLRLQLEKANNLIENNNIAIRGFAASLEQLIPDTINEVEKLIKYLDSSLLELQNYQNLFIKIHNTTGDNSQKLNEICKLKVDILDKNAELYMMKSNFYFEAYALLKGEGSKKRETAKQYLQSARDIITQAEKLEKAHMDAMSDLSRVPNLYSSTSTDYKQGVIDEYNWFFRVNTTGSSKDPENIDFLIQDARNTRDNEESFKKFNKALIVSITKKDTDKQFDIYYSQASTYFPYMQNKVNQAYNLQIIMDYSYKISAPLIAAANMILDNVAGKTVPELQTEILIDKKTRCESISVMLYSISAQILRNIVCYGEECYEALDYLKLAVKCQEHASKILKIIDIIIPYAPSLTKSVKDTIELITLTIEINKQAVLLKEAEERQYQLNYKTFCDSLENSAKSKEIKPQNNKSVLPKIQDNAQSKNHRDVNIKISPNIIAQEKKEDKEQIVHRVTYEENVVLLEDAKKNNHWHQQAYLNINISEYHLEYAQANENDRTLTKKDRLLSMIKNLKETLKYLQNAKDAIDKNKTISLEAVTAIPLIKVEESMNIVLSHTEDFLKQITEKLRKREKQLMDSRQIAMQKSADNKKEWFKEFNFNTLSKKAKELLVTKSHIRTLLTLNNNIQKIKEEQNTSDIIKKTEIRNYSKGQDVLFKNGKNNKIQNINTKDINKPVYKQNRIEFK